MSNPLFIKCKLLSRHKSEKYYDIFILIDEDRPVTQSVIAYYCTCKNDARTVGACACGAIATSQSERSPLCPAPSSPNQLVLCAHTRFSVHRNANMLKTLSWKLPWNAGGKFEILTEFKHLTPLPFSIRAPPLVRRFLFPAAVSPQLCSACNLCSTSCPGPAVRCTRSDCPCRCRVWKLTVSIEPIEEAAIKCFTSTLMSEETFLRYRDEAPLEARSKFVYRSFVDLMFREKMGGLEPPQAFRRLRL